VVVQRVEAVPVERLFAGEAPVSVRVTSWTGPSGPVKYRSAEEIGVAGKYTHSILAANQAVAADGVQVFDLPVNPLSAVLLHISPLNETAAVTSFQWLAGMLSAIDNVTVSFRGGAFVALSGIDLAALVLLWQRGRIWQSGAVSTNNDRRSLVIPVPFSRKPFDVKECFPATKKGELQMSVTWDIADTGFDALRISVETIELPGATPDYVQKVTTLARTLAAVGQNEIDLPIGNFLRGVLLFGTTGYTGAVPAPTLGQLQLLKDNVQQYISASDFEVLRGVMGLKGLVYPCDLAHRHSFADAAAGETFTRVTEVATTIDENYVLMDLDPLWDDSFGMETEGAGRVHVRIDAEAANAVRVIPIERVKSSVFLESA